jgi:hypothetical protein
MEQLNMKNVVAIGGLLLSLVFTTFSGVAQAADGSLCYSETLTVTQTGSTGTVTFPQITNATKFICNSGVPYTLKQLSAAGWIIENMQPTALSNTTTTNGTDVTVVSKSRYILTIQK